MKKWEAPAPLADGRDPLEVGRAVASLTNQTTGNSWIWRKAVENDERNIYGSRVKLGDYGYFRRSKDQRRRFPDEQIMRLFGLTKKELAYCRDAWAQRAGPEVTRAELVKQTREFVRKNGRWPRAKDFRTDKSVPSERMLYKHMSWNRINELGIWSGGLTRLYFEVAGKYKLTPKEVLAIPNVTVRRWAIERIGGIEKVVQHGELIQQDDFGKLWKLPGDTAREPMMYIEVVNSTKNPDGTYDHYFLRVPPDSKTAREAVAWTFNVQPEELLFAAQS